MSSIFTKSLFLGKGEAFGRVRGGKRHPLGEGPLGRGTTWERDPAKGVRAWGGGVEDKERGHSLSRGKRKMWQLLTRREEEQRGGEGGFRVHKARETRPRLCSNCLALVPVAPDLGALGSFLISLLRDVRAANASPCRKSPCKTGKIHFAPRAHTTPRDESDNC